MYHLFVCYIHVLHKYTRYRDVCEYIHTYLYTHTHLYCFMLIWYIIYFRHIRQTFTLKATAGLSMELFFNGLEPSRRQSGNRFIWTVLMQREVCEVRPVGSGQLLLLCLLQSPGMAGTLLGSVWRSALGFDSIRVTMDSGNRAGPWWGCMWQPHCMSTTQKNTPRAASCCILAWRSPTLRPAGGRKGRGHSPKTIYI